MKRFIPMLNCAALAMGLLAGCGEKSNPPAAPEQLTAADLAYLTDFHAWKTAIPPAQQPVKEVRLVMVNDSNGTVVTKSVASQSTPPEPWSTLLLGMRAEGERLTGELYIQYSQGGGVTWKFDFTDAFANSNPGWSMPGALAWNGNRATLATSLTNGSLALELEK